MEDTLCSSEVLREAAEASAADARQSAAAGVAMTLADVLERVEGSGLKAATKRDLRWVINTFCSALGLAPIDVPAEARAIRANIERLSPAMLGIEPGTFSNIRSGLRRALRLSGNAARPRVRHEPLSNAWADLYSLLQGRDAQARLGAFISFCSEQGYLPDEVGDPHLARFAEMLEASSINPKWLEIVKGTVRQWNKTVYSTKGWPQTKLSSPGGKAEPLCLPWEQLPVSFRQDAESYLAFLADPPLDDDFAPAKPLRRTTIEGRRFKLRQSASVLLRSGWPPDSLAGLSELLKPAALDTILRFFEPGQDGAGRTQLLQIVLALKVIGKYWTKADGATMVRLQKEIRRHGKKRRGMVRKNREKLAILKDDQVAARLMLLPVRLFAALEKVKKPKEREANLALAALVIELLLMWPARVGNLSSIHMQKNIVRSGKGPEATVSLHFDADEVKNDMELEADLPPSAVQFLDLFIKKYRPLLIHEPSLYLFPAHNGGPRSPRTLWNTITTVTERYVGVSINPHLFRHVGANYYLRANPGKYEVVRRSLGHRSMDTTTGSYVGAETDAALRLYDENMLRLRAEAPAVLARGRRRSRKRDPLAARSSTETGRELSHEPSIGSARDGGDSDDEL